MNTNKESFSKLIFFFLIFLSLLTSNFSYAELNSKNWTKLCDKNQKNNCFIGITNTYYNEDTKKNEKFATVYIEKKKEASIITVNLPLNTDLNVKPLISTDGVDLLNMVYLFCNNILGCSASALLNEKSISSFKSGNTLTISFAGYGNKKNYLKINVPLKEFSKSYKNYNK